MMTGENIIVALIAATTPFLALFLNELNRRRERRLEKIERERIDTEASATATARNDQTQETLKVIRTEVNGNLRQGIIAEIAVLKQTALVEMEDKMSAKLAEFYIQLSAEKAVRRRLRKSGPTTRRKS